MTGPGHRLDRGGRIDRERPRPFWYNGRKLEGYAGDTLASALIANGVDVVARSFKYRRPRGILAGGAEEPNAILQVDDGGRVRPVERATQVELYSDLQARMVNAWPSPERDYSGALGLFSRFLPAGFYYKTFMWPRRFWERYETIIRRGAGLGFAPDSPDPDTYDKRFAHCDVLIAGAGPAGLAAALAAGRAGARVILADEQNEPGGSLLGNRDQIQSAPAMDWVAQARAELEAMPEVTFLPRTTVFGYYDHNFLGLLERCTDHLARHVRRGPRQRLWKVRTRQVIAATGAIERPLVFANNDRPGVMLASAVSTYIHRFGVAPGRRAVVFANNDNGYRTALDMHRAGIEVAAIIDSRSESGGEWQEKAREAGLAIRSGQVVTEALGGKRVRGVRAEAFDPDTGTLEGGATRIDCDLIAMSGGWSPVIHLHSQSGARPRYDADKAAFVPGKSVQPERSAGSSNATFGLAGCLKEGLEAGQAAATDCGFEAPANDPPDCKPTAENPLQPLWRVPHAKPPEKSPKQFVDYQNDATVADLHLALRENYSHIEHVKRYTALGFGTDQGKLGNINGMAIVAEHRGIEPQEVGTTTFRPPYTPVTLGAIAGRDVGPLLDPIRHTPMHPWHLRAGAAFENAGQWKRARYYPQGTETMQEAVDRECLATHESIGVLDYSTLGKIDIKGPDAANLLDRIYTNNWQKLKVGRCRYGLMLTEDGMVMDDGVTACLGENHYLMHTTTGGAARVLAWMEQWLQTEWPDMKVYLTSVSDHLATVVIGGPNARKLTAEICEGIDFSAENFRFFSWKEGRAAGVWARVMRVSFSGELSFEITVEAQYGLHLWETVMEAGRKYNATPYGTETMHVLRAEKGFIICGQETDGSVSPLDLGMDGLLSKKKDFLGKRSLQRSDLIRTDRRQFVGLRTENDDEVLPEGAQLVTDPNAPKPIPMVGYVTSSYYSARCGHSIALALIDGGRDRMNETVQAPLADGRVVRATITSPVFFDPEGSRQNV